MSLQIQGTQWYVDLKRLHGYLVTIYWDAKNTRKDLGLNMKHFSHKVCTADLVLSVCGMGVAHGPTFDSVLMTIHIVRLGYAKRLPNHVHAHCPLLTQSSPLAPCHSANFSSEDEQNFPAASRFKSRRARGLTWIMNVWNWELGVCKSRWISNIGVNNERTLLEWTLKMKAQTDNSENHSDSGVRSRQWHEIWNIRLRTPPIDT